MHEGDETTNSMIHRGSKAQKSETCSVRWSMGQTSDFLTWSTRGFECATAFPSAVCAHRLHRTSQEQRAVAVRKRLAQSNLCQP